MTARIVADRLYGIQLRPQELALYGEQVRIDLRYAPVFEDPDEVTATHYKLLVCEISAELPADDALRRPAGQLNVAAAGLDGLINNLTGNRMGGNLLGALLGQAPRPQGQAAGSNGLSNLPPFRIEDGRVLFGPFAVPNLRLPPLY